MRAGPTRKAAGDETDPRGCRCDAAAGAEAGEGICSRVAAGGRKQMGNGAQAPRAAEQPAPGGQARAAGFQEIKACIGCRQMSSFA